MNELNISSYIQIMQSGFRTHDKQESAGVFLLSSINDQDYVADQGYWTSNLSSKKISRLVSRDDPVPDGLRQASMQQIVIDKTIAYFKKEIMPDLNRADHFAVRFPHENILRTGNPVRRGCLRFFQRFYLINPVLRSLEFPK